MQTFTFDQLDERGKDAAWFRYQNDSLFQSISRKSPKMSIKNIFSQLAWRFTIHGERVA